MLRQIGLVARGAKLRRAVKRLHHSAGVAVGVHQDFAVGYLARNAVSIFIDHHRRNAHDIAGVPFGGFQALNGVANHAGHAVVVELPVHQRVLGERTRKQPDGIMTAIAVAREFDALGVVEQIHTGSVKRLAEGVRVQRLAPLVICLLMAVGAIGGIGKSSRLDEASSLHLGIAGIKGNLLAKSKIVSGRDLFRVRLPLALQVLALFFLV